jgi:Spy/CpxP family protein refolding chaperone
LEEELAQITERFSGDEEENQELLNAIEDLKVRNTEYMKKKEMQMKILLSDPYKFAYYFNNPQ